MSAGIDGGGDDEREPPYLRTHSTYEKPHWETAHIERVENIGAFESYPFGDGPIRSRETIRVDLDGYGHGGASMHDPDDNVQVSFWLTPETAIKLADPLESLLKRAGVDRDGPDWPEDLDAETTAYFEHMIATWRCGDCGTEFTIDSVFASTRRLDEDVSCPVCPTDADHVKRTGDHPERSVVDE